MTLVHYCVQPPCSAGRIFPCYSAPVVANIFLLFSVFLFYCYIYKRDDETGNRNRAAV